MGLIKYIMRERERRFRAGVVNWLTTFNIPPAAKWDFINGNDKILSELADWKEFREWKKRQDRDIRLGHKNIGCVPTASPGGQ